jgi:hypothetical protein
VVSICCRRIEIGSNIKMGSQEVGLQSRRYA